jgi:hypothetical protein
VTHLNYLLARQRQAELAERAERARQLQDGGLHGQAPNNEADRDADFAITLRLAGPEDATGIADLAGLDSAAVPADPLLIAEAGGTIRAAVSVRDGAMIADPFHRTTAARELLRARAAQLRGDRETRWPRRILGREAPATTPRRANPSAASGEVTK